MKRFLITAAFIAGISVAAGAQTTGSNSSNGTTHSSEGNKKKSKKKGKAALNHRRNYNWKSGQQATPTGQEATGTGSGYSAGKKIPPANGTSDAPFTIDNGSLTNGK